MSEKVVKSDLFILLKVELDFNRKQPSENRCLTLEMEFYKESITLIFQVNRYFLHSIF